MQLSEDARAAQKEAQLARLAAKGSPEYPQIYAQQPDQIRIAAEQGAARAKERALKNSAEGFAVGDAAAAVADFGNIATKKGDK